MKQQVQTTDSNLIRSPLATLTRSNSTSTVILDEDIHWEQQMDPPVSLPMNNSTTPRSILKISGLFNRDLEPSDKLNELFANDNEFTLHRLLSDVAVSDTNIDMNEIVKFDPVKLLDTRSISEFLQYDSFNQMNMTHDIQLDHVDNLSSSAIACSSGSFSELYPPTPDPPVKEVFQIGENQLKIELENSSAYAPLNPLDTIVLTPTTTSIPHQEFNLDPCVLAAFEHDYGFLPKRTTAIETPSPSPSPSPTISKRTTTRGFRRTSSRLQSRAALFDVNQLLNNDTCLPSENNSIASKKVKYSRHINRATDIQTEDDLSYYLERRRKNNEASKQSRAARKQKFGDMHLRCAEYERINTELRSKISTLEIITNSLKSSLITNFQRTNALDPKF